MPQTERTQKRQQPHSVAPGVWMWSMEYGDGESFFNSFLVETSNNKSALIDPLFYSIENKPLFDWSVFDKLPKPEVIWLTSSDHERDSEQFQKRFDIPVCSAKLEARMMGIKPDMFFEQNESLEGDWQAIFLDNQKTPSECVFYHARRQLLIVGDAILAQADGRLRRPYDAPSYTNEEKAKKGLEILKELPVDIILTGHGDPVTQKAQTLLRDAIDTDPRDIAQSANR